MASIDTGVGIHSGTNVGARAAMLARFDDGTAPRVGIHVGNLRRSLRFYPRASAWESGFEPMESLTRVRRNPDLRHVPMRVTR